MNNFKGVRDIMEKKRYRPKDVKDVLNKKNVPGNWKEYQNLYNLINGVVRPKDPYVYIVIANLLEESIESIILRYSDATGFNQAFLDQTEQKQERSLDWDDLY
jgi:hypothetical protein